MTVRKHYLTWLFWVAVACIGLPDTSRSDEVVDLGGFIDDPESLDEVDQRTPLKTAQGFMRFAELGDYEGAAEFLDLRYLPDSLENVDGSALAQQLYVIISRKLPIDFASLSDQPAGAENDGLPSYRDELGVIETSQGEVSIYLQLVPGTDDRRVWKISNASIAGIPNLYKDFGYSPFVETVREWIPRGSFLGAESFKWVISIIAAVVAVSVWLMIAWPLGRILAHRNEANRKRVIRYLTRPIPTLLFFAVGAGVLKNLGLGVTASRVAEGGTLITLASVWFLFATINLLRDLYAQYLMSRGRDSGLMLLSPVTSTAKVVVGALASVVWLDNMGVNVTALVAGLGVGGLAVALVLQKPLEDVMGAITLYTQQPVTVGQYCTAGNVTGTVEEINLRTTRIRTINNSVVVVPNAVFATASIENITERSRILHRQTLRLALETSESVVRSVLQELRSMLLAVETVADDSSRVRLIDFGEFSINIEVFAHIGTTDWPEFLEIAENINLASIGVLERLGAKLAEPPR